VVELSWIVVSQIDLILVTESTVVSRRREPAAESVEDLARLQRSGLESDFFVAAQKTKREDAGNFEDFTVCSVDVEKVSWLQAISLGRP
jgi:hypothetical protein